MQSPVHAKRLVSALFALSLGVLLLWRAGLLDGSEERSVVGGEVALSPAVALEDVDGVLGEGAQAPDFEFSDFGGVRHKLSDYRGRALVLNFWATWCGPCRVELPDLEAALREYEPRGLAVVAVNAGESFRSAERWLRQTGVQLTAFAYDPTQVVTRLYGVNYGLPVTYFIDASGRITRVQAGQVTPGIARSGIEEALKASLQREP